MRIKDTKSFIAKARKVHGDRYDYSQTVWIKSTLEITIICPIHGKFEQQPGNHIKGNNCKQCGLIARSKRRTKTVTNFITKARQVHGDKYDYSQTIYSHSQKKVKIICKTLSLVICRIDSPSSN